MEFNGFHFNGGAGLDLFLQVTQDPDAPERVILNLRVNGSLLVKELSIPVHDPHGLTPAWARARIMEMIPISDKMRFFFGPEMRAYQDGKINADQTTHYVIQKMKGWSVDEIEPIEKEFTRIFNDSK
jgi:hypothetical protein